MIWRSSTVGILFVGRVCGVLSAVLAKPEKRTFAGLLGFLLGPIGLVVVAIAMRNEN